MKLLRGVFAVLLLVGCDDGSGAKHVHDFTDGGALDGATGFTPDPAIVLAASAPADGATDVPGTSWIRLELGAPLPSPGAHGITLSCGDGTPAIDVDALDASTLVVNPRAPLPPAASCALRLPDGSSLGFTTAAAGEPALVPYDRTTNTGIDPFPDDYYLVPDSSTETGYRVDVTVPEVEASLKGLFASAIEPTAKLDGMSPLAPIAVKLPDTLDPASVPHGAKESLDPLATLALFDIDPSSSEHGKRIPFDALYRDETNVDGSASHMLVVFPSYPLRPRGHYAFVVTTRAFVNASRPLGASPFFTTVASGGGSAEAEKRLRPFLSAVLDELRTTTPPLRVDDLALALGITVRSVDDIPSDLLSIRERTQAAPPPSFTITSVEADATKGSSVAAIVHGTWSPPTWSTDGKFLDRDAAGKPKSGAPSAIPFTLAIPKSDRPAPIVMYQHGQPGSAEREVPETARSGFAAAGFAVIGFTDFANRNVIPDGNVVTLNTDALTSLLVSHQLPDYLSLLTHAEQLAFVRMLPAFAGLDVLPMGANDGTPDLDLSAPLGYFGISQGSIHGAGLLAFTPEIHAAALTVGAGRFTATLVHQEWELLYKGIGGVFPTFSHADFYAGLSLVQMDYDHQDSQNLAAHLYRQPLELGDVNRASVLLTEGLGDTEVPYYGVRAGAYALGIPQLEPHAEDVPFLDSARGPLDANMNAKTTAGFFQFVPYAYPGAALPTAGCVTLKQKEGHYCAQDADEAVEQRIAFFRSALSGVPRVAAPLVSTRD